MFLNQKGNVAVIVLSIFVALALAGGAYFYGKSESLKAQIDSISTPSSTEASQNVVSSSTPTATPNAKTKATVVFEAEGSFTQSEKDELKKKVINPFVDYYEMEETEQVLLTFTVSKNLQASKDTYPYQGQAILQGGGNMGFLIMKSGSGVDWWFPECMMGCNLSAAYKAKYPEIAAKVQ